MLFLLLKITTYDFSLGRVSNQKTLKNTSTSENKRPRRKPPALCVSNEWNQQRKRLIGALAKRI
jgi:hypothetical protein